MHTILGSGGVTGIELARQLASKSAPVRLVSRKPKPVNTADQLVSGDLLDNASIKKAVEGSEVVYLLAGLKYDIKVWIREWPLIMENVIEACKAAGCRLVFLDNVYMYGKVEGKMTEDTPHNPCSRKGEVRAQIATRLMEEVAAGSLEAMIARSADFYGPGATNTFMEPMVFAKLKEGKKASWIGNAHVPHSFTFTPDIGRALAVLGSTPDAFGRVWHLPTAPDPFTGDLFIKKAASLYGTEPKYNVLSKFMMQLVSPFNSIARETVEMIYQYDRPYYFDSSRFAGRFFGATAYEEGLRQIVSK